MLNDLLSVCVPIDKLFTLSSHFEMRVGAPSFRVTRSAESVVTASPRPPMSRTVWRCSFLQWRHPPHPKVFNSCWIT